ncbi:MAG: hypothetical protein HYU25_02740 [Candidatus Rokubacteria bacterium]|nr:hypothetical protein [Candidatus Rokubacteria bacterium]
MWCHLLLLVPVAGLGLFFVLPWPVALALNVVLAAIAVGIAIPGMRALRQPVLTGREALVGRVAEAVTEIGREGFVRCEGELWTASANGHRISKGTRVSVTGVEGLRLAVQPVEPDAAKQRMAKKDE